MSFFQSLLTGGGMDVIWTLGDSKNRGHSTAVGATPPVNGSVRQWDAGAGNLRNITNLDLLEPVAAGAIGSQWPQFGITYYEQTGRIPVFVNCGVGGSAFYNPTAGFSWYTNDTLFANALTKVQNCLAYMGKGAPTYVIIGSGYNDAVQASALSFTYITSLVDRVLAAFPGVKIGFTLPFSSSATVSTYANLTRLFQIRKWIKSLLWLYPEVEICGEESVLDSWGGCFNADLVHYNAAGNGFIGDKSAIGLVAGNGYHKYTRSLIGAMYWRITNLRRGWLDAYIRALDTAGQLQLIDSLQVPATGGNDTGGVGWKNAMIDFGFIANSQAAGPLSYYTYLGWNPLGAVDADRINKSPYTLVADKAVLLSGFIAGMRITLNGIASGTIAAPMGVRESAAGGLIMMRQNVAGNIGYFAGDGVETLDTTDTRFVPGNWYSVKRTSGNKYLVKNATASSPVAQAASALNPGANIRSFTVGNFNNNGTIQNRWAGTTDLIFLADDDLNMTTFVSETNSFLALWLQNIP